MKEMYTRYGIKRYRRKKDEKTSGWVWPGATRRIQQWEAFKVRPTDLKVNYYKPSRPTKLGFFHIDTSGGVRARNIFVQMDILYQMRRPQKLYHKPLVKLMMSINGIEVVG